MYPLQALTDGEPVVVGKKGVMAQGIQALGTAMIGMSPDAKKSKSGIGSLWGLLRAS